MSNLEDLISQNELPHFQGTFNNKLVITRPSVYSYRSDSIIKLSPSHLLMRKMLSSFTPMTGGSLALDLVLHQINLYMLVWSRRTSKILKIFTLGINEVQLSGHSPEKDDRKLVTF